MPAVLFPGASPEPLTAARIRAGRPPRRLGRLVRHFSAVGSTQDVARDMAHAGAPEGLLVLAEEQTAGRGRYGRRWEAPPGSSLLASLLLRPTFLPPERAFLLTALAALGIAEAVAQQTGLDVALKWPNDLLVAGRKACGILVELEGQPDRLEWALLGWGLNVNVDFSTDEALSRTATSLAAAAGRPWERLPLLWACLERLEARYEAVRAGREEEVWAGWRARLSLLGAEVAVATPGETFTGRALDVAPDGALLVRRADGRLERVLAGDVTLRL